VVTITKATNVDANVANAEISLESLEIGRTMRSTIPASKHGLENICGASCETGAQ
jgi:hypothetical protein